MKQLYFISTGRCGTKRIKEILTEVLDPSEFSIEHQVGMSRLANVLGNVMFYLGDWQWLKRILHRRLLNDYAHKENFISTDPLTAMIFPDEVILGSDVMLVHVVRDRQSFAGSIFRLSRERTKSKIAHNLIPLWQPGVWPLENLLSSRILEKYERVWTVKNAWFEQQYGKNPNYRKIDMSDLFDKQVMEGIIRDHFGRDIDIPEQLLGIRSNQTVGTDGGVPGTTLE